ncbi:hypothetical protein AURDEDRAFT_172433 [Auricularia subglabra TFB-10046 SS5]|nr:hypothetical protein AURDEDRAFT_172433 [Auricularia subglabra TFB-10046 SS5]
MHVMLMDADGRQGAVQAVEFHPNWTRPLVSTSRLCIGGLAALPSEVLDSSSLFPSLEELTLDVTPALSAFTFGRYKWPRLACPALRAVRLRSATTILNIPLDAVSAFLRGLLDAGPGKLAVIELDRVHILAPPGVDALTSLYTLAETVSILEADSTWPECHLRWNKSWDAVLH